MFAQQLSAIAILKGYIRRQIGYTGGTDAETSELYLQRRVFARVGIFRSGVLRGANFEDIWQVREGEEYVVLAPAEDPSADAAKIRARWAVSSRVQIGRMTGEGKIARCAHYLIRPGDFVEAIITFDIATYGTGNERACQVHLALEQLVQIESRKEKVGILAFVN